MQSGNLTPRQELILRLIVREHVRTAKEVASRTLVERYRLGFSPATVRNEMSRLEELGYLWQPHTSAGRRPTEEGFRYFVERLMEEQSLPTSEQRMIAHQFYQAHSNSDEWWPLASVVLARATSGAAIVTAPRTTRAIYKHLELIAIHGRNVLLVLVLQGGAVEQQMLTLSRAVTQRELREMADRLNRACGGLTRNEIAGEVQHFAPPETDILQLVLAIMEQAERVPADEIYHHGLASLLREPEFTDGEAPSADVVRVLEEASLLRAVLSDTLPSVVGGVRVLIGGEGNWEELQSCSLVLARYGANGYATGALGVVGPMRMPYGRAISVVRFVANVLGELVQEMYQVDVPEITP